MLGAPLGLVTVLRSSSPWHQTQHWLVASRSRQQWRGSTTQLVKGRPPTRTTIVPAGSGDVGPMTLKQIRPIAFGISICHVRILPHPRTAVSPFFPTHSPTTMLLRLRSSFSPVFRHRCLLAATTSASADAAAASRCTTPGGGDVVDGYSSCQQQQTQQRRGMAFQKSFVSLFVVAIMLDLLHQLLAWICVDRSGC
jgi:hypothetical protein